MNSKPGAGRGDKKSRDKDKDKEHDKFSKLERGGKKGKMAPKSLEKQVRNKKSNKPKVVEPEVEEVILPVGTVMINVPITVAGFAEQTKTTVSQIIMTLMKMGVMANVNQNLDEDTVVLLAEELGIQVVIGKIEEEEVEEGIEGLIHVTELGKKVKSPSELFKEGDSVQAKIIHVSADERRLGLSIKQIKDDEERRKPKDYHSGDNSISQTLGDLLKQKFND